ncbi:Uncharacterized protein RNJ44_03097 [Nakaseomyces bracarensis]|uniref:Uncharacterized protein n=1 Tax=Nakaseomyces bracarensis TaxID=273131 RepID=A0ABR4NZ01_9SACH
MPNKLTIESLTQLGQDTLGTLTFDEKHHLVDTSGIGEKINKSFVADAVRKSNDELGKFGYQVYEDSKVVGHAFKDGSGKTTVYLTDKAKSGAEKTKEAAHRG